MHSTPSILFRFIPLDDLPDDQHFSLIPSKCLRKIPHANCIIMVMFCIFWCPAVSYQQGMEKNMLFIFVWYIKQSLSLIQSDCLVVWILAEQSLLNTFPDAGILISGDRNDLGNDRLLSVEPSLRQIVNEGTRGPNILDILLTNLHIYLKNLK